MSFHSRIHTTLAVVVGIAAVSLAPAADAAGPEPPRFPSAIPAGPGVLTGVHAKTPSNLVAPQAQERFVSSYGEVPQIRLHRPAGREPGDGGLAWPLAVLGALGLVAGVTLARRRVVVGRRRALVRLGAMVVVVGGIAAGEGSPAAGANTPGTPRVSLAWGTCADGPPAPFQCATVNVPLDHRRPHGRTIALAVIRHPATDPDRRIGSLFMNPGGPGGSGVDLVAGITPFLALELRERFDIVGFDPRGVARSRQIQCWDAAQFDAAWAATRIIEAPSFSTAIDHARSFVDACVRRSGDLLPYIGTKYVARDMDLLRAAVGDDKLTYLGFSYGTYIGTVYANLFPERVRALALDGAYDPITYARRPYQYDRGQFAALERSLVQFLNWCSANPDPCGFGDGNAKAAFDALMAELDANPRMVETPYESGPVNAATTLFEFPFAVVNGGIQAWPGMGARLAEIADGTGVFPMPEFLTDWLAANTAVECVDRAYPRSLRLLERRLRQHSRLGERLGPLFAYGPPSYDHSHAAACVLWPKYAGAHAPSRYRGRFDAHTAAPILVVGSTGDPDTPYQDAIALSQILENAELITFRGETHTGSGGSECVRTQITAYLVALERPRTFVCDDEAPIETETDEATAVLRATHASGWRAHAKSR